MKPNRSIQRGIMIAALAALGGGALAAGCSSQGEIAEEVPLGRSAQDLSFRPVRPILDCIDDLGDGNYRAHFGYANHARRKRHIPVGWRNRFIPRPRYQGQPTWFLPGEHKDVFTVDFAVGDGWDRVAWWLSGRRALATASSPLCDDAPECVADADCSDDNECTLDVCTDGTCSNSNAPIGAECGPGGELACDGEGSCSLEGCDTDAECSDDNECTDDVCQSGLCENTNSDLGQQCGPGGLYACNGTGDCNLLACETSADCNDNNSCTNDSCDSGACFNTNADLGTQCGPGGLLACDGNGSCSLISCYSDATCNDDNQCTADACQSGVCVNDNQPLGFECGPGNLFACDGQGDCSLEGCDTDADCNDDNQCTSDACSSGVCDNQPSPLGTQCGPGNLFACDGAGDCSLLSCTDDSVCGDDNQCTVDSCDSGACSNVPAPVGTLCGPGNLFACDGQGACSLLSCSVSSDCDDNNQCTADSCSSNACSNEPLPAGTLCGPGNLFTCDGAGSCG